MRYALRDADIAKLALCKQGANRHRVFLLKTGEDREATTAMVPLIKEAKKDWRVAYVPVAVPNAEEDQGVFKTGDGDVDFWESEDEIVKAAHSFIRNGAQLIGQHFDSGVVEGARVVENAVALDDFMVGDQKIAKGTWYVGLEFDDEKLRGLVDSGEIDAVSVEGFASRVAKVETFSKPGVADFTPSERLKAKPLAMHYLAMVHPFTTCVRDQVKHGLPPDHAKRRCAVLLDAFDPQRLRHSTAKVADEAEWTLNVAEVLEDLAGSLDDVEGECVGCGDTSESSSPSDSWVHRTLDRVVKAMGMEPDPCDCEVCTEYAAADDLVFPEDPAELAKAAMTYAARKKLPKSAFVYPEKAPGPGSYPIHDHAHRANALARGSHDPKVVSAVCKREPSLPKCKERKVAKEEASLADDGTVEDVELGERVEALEGRLAKIETNLIGDDENPGQITRIGKQLEALTERLPEKPAEPEPTVAEAVAKTQENFEKFVEEQIVPLAKRLEAVEESESEQVEQEPVAKSNGNEPATAGILFDE